jgi:electron transfer flavoprotein beta subunit
MRVVAMTATTDPMAGPTADAPTDATADQARSCVGVAMKYVPLRVDVNPLTGAVRADDRLAGASPADEAALEYALRFAEAWGCSVVAASAGDRRCEPMLRSALASGATSAVRVDLPLDAAAQVVAAALASALGSCDLIFCGNHSLDRGSGSVPAFLAGQLGAAQALGLVSVTQVGVGSVEAERRLDGGRRERIRVTTPGVVSVEPGLRLRRASLPAVLRARVAPLEVRPSPMPYALDPASGTRRPYRPRPKALPAPAATLPARDRMLMLTGALTNRRAPAVVRTDDPAAAADTLLAFLRDRNYLQ